MLCNERCIPSCRQGPGQRNVISCPLGPLRSLRNGRLPKYGRVRAGSRENLLAVSEDRDGSGCHVVAAGPAIADDRLWLIHSNLDGRAGPSEKSIAVARRVV